MRREPRRKRHAVSAVSATTPSANAKSKAKFGGASVSDTRSPRAFENKTNRLRRMLADTMLVSVVRKDLATKNY